MLSRLPWSNRQHQVLDNDISVPSSSGNDDSRSNRAAEVFQVKINEGRSFLGLFLIDPVVQAQAGMAAVGIFLLAAHATSHVAGQSSILAVILAALVSLGSGRPLVGEIVKECSMFLKRSKNQSALTE